MTRERFKANIRKLCLPSKWPFLDEVIDPIFDQQDKLEAELKAKGDEIAKAKKGLDDLKQEVECHRKRFAEQSAKENRGVVTDDPCRKGSRGMYT